jgi:hypothetical protein
MFDVNSFVFDDLPVQAFMALRPLRSNACASDAAPVITAFIALRKFTLLASRGKLRNRYMLVWNSPQCSGS